MKQYRTLIYVKLQLESPLHLGSGRDEDPFSDQPVLRDICGVPIIAGSSLAGSFAASLANDKKYDWMGIRPEDPQASPLIMDDAAPVPAQAAALRWPVELRSQVSLERASLTALPDHHFNMEVLPLGVIFCLSCRCDLDDTEAEEEFLAAMKKFLARGGRLGGKQNSGLGLWRCREWGHRTLDMTRREDLRLWLTDLHGHRWKGDWGVLAQFGITHETVSKVDEPDSDWRMELEIKVEKGLHLSAGQSGLPEKNVPDLQQVKRWRIEENGGLQEELTDYGSAVKGRLRTAMEMMLRTYLIQFCNKEPADAFNIVPLDPTKPAGHEKLKDFFGCCDKKGAWRVTEGCWEDGKIAPQDHIRLDEFTQFVIGGAKFDFAPLSRGKQKMLVILPPDAEEWQKVLVYYAGKLLTRNIFPWGGHGSRGYIGAMVRIANEADIIISADPRKELKNLLASIMAK